MATSALVLTACGTLGGEPGARAPSIIFDDHMTELAAVRDIKASNPEFDSSHIVAVSHNGVVLLIGEVASEALKQQASAVVESMEHVTGVHNELSIGEALSLADLSNDAWLTTKVKTKLIADADIDADRINVTTENRVVYLMGTVSRDQADRAVDVSQTVSGVDKIVRVFEYVD